MANHGRIMEVKTIILDIPDYGANYRLPVTITANAVLWSHITGTEASLRLSINDHQYWYSAEFNLLNGTERIERWLNNILTETHQVTVKVEYGTNLRDHMTTLTTGLLGKCYKNHKFLDLNDIRNMDKVRDELHNKVTDLSGTLHRISDQLPWLINY